MQLVDRFMPKEGHCLSDQASLKQYLRHHMTTKLKHHNNSKLILKIHLGTRIHKPCMLSYYIEHFGSNEIFEIKCEISST